MKTTITATTSRRFPYTEEEMADAFERFLKTGRTLPGVGRLSRIFREVDCQRGRPDFVALARGSTRFLSGKSISAKFSGSLVLSFLHERAPRSLAYLSDHSGLSRRVVSTAAGELVKRRYALRTESGSYLLNPARPLRQVQVWAFELKLDKPKRAVFQAQQYRSFAQRVLIVAPPSQLALYSKFGLAMKRWGIGLATFDPVTGQFIIHRPPRVGDPHSRHHQAYALFQLLGDGQSAQGPELRDAGSI
jgi:hypothetical protein